MSHHSGSESDHKDLTKRQNEAASNEGGGNVTIQNLYMEGGNFGNIKHEGSRETITAMKMTYKGGTFTATENDARNTLAVQAPSGNISAEESPSTSGATRTTGKDCVKLSDTIWLFKERRLAEKALVFEGVQKSKIFPDQQLAIKLIWHYTEKNRREAVNLLKLRPHTHVVAIVHADVYKPGPEIDCLYIAMKRCSTLNLEDYIKERRSKNVPFNPNEAFEHARQVIDAIDHIHGHNIMHRDLKPSSILFSLPRGALKICDFGMSKELQNGRTMTGLSTLTVGTDGYRAPETYNKNDISHMADIFSLALVLYHLLSYGFHPFGIDPDIWKSNIKKGQGLDLSRLRDPFLKIVKELLEKMLNFEPNSRLKIDEVKNSGCMKLDWCSSLIESLVPIWNGVVKDHVSADVLPCRLYRSPSLHDDIEIDESGWKFQMNTFPNIGSLKKVTDEEPSGYIVTSKDDLKKLTDKLTRSNLMGFIDISKDGKESKVIVLLHQPGHPELFGFFLPDAKNLTSLIGNISPKQGSTPQKPASGPGYQGWFGSFSPTKFLTSIFGNLGFKQGLTSQRPAADPAYQPSNLQAQASEPSSTSAEPAPVSTETSTSGNVDQVQFFTKHDPTEEQEAASATNQWKQTTPGLIPWWIYTGDLQK